MPLAVTRATAHGGRAARGHSAPATRPGMAPECAGSSASGIARPAWPTSSCRSPCCTGPSPPCAGGSIAWACRTHPLARAGRGRGQHQRRRHGQDAARTVARPAPGACRAQARGRHPLVCGQRPAPAHVRGDDDPAIRGDEAVLLAATLTCPVWSGPDRRETARALLQAHPKVDMLLCDDGLQHYALERDVEIAVVDAARGFGNRLPLPAGPLREPLSRLRHVDLIVINGDQPVADLPADVPHFTMTLRGTQFRNLVDPAASRRPKPSSLSGSPRSPASVIRRVSLRTCIASGSHSKHAVFRTTIASARKTCAFPPPMRS